MKLGKIAFWICACTTSMSAVVFFALPNFLTTISFVSCMLALLTVNRSA